MSIKVKLIKWDEFYKMLVEYIVNDWKNYSKENIVETLLENGFVKLDKNDLGKFFKGIHTVFLPIPTVAVDFGCGQFYWLVSGSNAILIHKKEVDIIED